MSGLGNKEVFACNLNRYMSRDNKKPIDICNDLNFPPTTFSEWVNAKSYPRIDKIEMLANYFGIQKSDLIEKIATPRQSRGVKIPVLGKVAAGIPVEAIEDIIDYEEITEQLAATGNFFGLYINGDSMEPKFSKGDVVIVRQQADVESGEIAVVLINGQDATLKRFIKYDDSICLFSSNPAYEPRFFSLKEARELPVSIIGKVIELRAKF